MLGETFVTRKVTRSVAQIHLGYMESVSHSLVLLVPWRCVMLRVLSPLLCQFKLGNLDAKRDWGHARDYVEVRTGRG